MYINTHVQYFSGLLCLNRRVVDDTQFVGIAKETVDGSTIASVYAAPYGGIDGRRIQIDNRREPLVQFGKGSGHSFQSAL